MTQIFEKSKDVHARANCIYVKAGDSYGYTDSGCTEKITLDEMKHAFEMGTLIIDGVKEYKPVGFTVASNVGTLTYVKPNATTATAADLATLKSA